MADNRPADDASIPSEEPLYIRIYPAPDSIVLLPDGAYRPNSGSLRGRSRDEPVSIDLGSLSTPEQTRDRGTNGNFHVATIKAGTLRDLGLRIVRDPITDGDIPNPAHALVIGSRKNSDENQAGGLTEGELAKMARAARLVIITPQPAAN